MRSGGVFERRRGDRFGPTFLIQILAGPAADILFGACCIFV
jgi:hypothetical protein